MDLPQRREAQLQNQRICRNIPESIAASNEDVATLEAVDAKSLEMPRRLNRCRNA
jgi:hypothetical protein